MSEPVEGGSNHGFDFIPIEIAIATPEGRDCHGAGRSIHEQQLQMFETALDVFVARVVAPVAFGREVEDGGLAVRVFPYMYPAGLDFAGNYRRPCRPGT